MTVKAEAPMVKFATVFVEVVHRGTCQKVLEWKIKMACYDIKDKYEVASKSKVPECLEPKNG